jgi:hypothetical protein
MREMERNIHIVSTLSHSALLPWCVLCLALWCAPTWAQAPGAKKLIYYGWGIRDTQYIREHWHEMEQMPFDGTGMIVAIDRQSWQQGKTDTGNQLGWMMMGKRAFRVEEFREAIGDLKAAQWRVFTDNFSPIVLSTAQSAAGLNWFDDERWRIITLNFAVVAQIAADGGLKGLILDPEHYKYALFRYADQRQQVDRPFVDYVGVARQRGREIMAAVAVHLPRAVLFSLYAYTLPLSERERGKRLEDTEYSLLPAFYDGLLDAMPAGTFLVDGYESAYAFKERRQFLESYRRIRQDAVELSAVPDRYRQHVKAGFGLWLDYRQKLEHFTPTEFRQGVSAALEVSDGYVWIYSHGPRFFPAANVDPSYIEGLAEARRGVRR